MNRNRSLKWISAGIVSVVGTALLAVSGASRVAAAAHVSEAPFFEECKLAAVKGQRSQTSYNGKVGVETVITINPKAPDGRSRQAISLQFHPPAGVTFSHEDAGDTQRIKVTASAAGTHNMVAEFTMSLAASAITSTKSSGSARLPASEYKCTVPLTYTVTK